MMGLHGALRPPAERLRKRSIRLRQRIVRWTSQHRYKLVMFGIALSGWLVVHVYWYNKLTYLEYNVQAAWAQVETEQQRRYHIQQSMIRLVVGYARHERDLMTDLTELRTTARDAATRRGDTTPRVPGVATPSQGFDTSKVADDVALDKLPPDQLDAMFPQIMIAAEQYPNLRLTENFQQFSQAIIDTETRIADHLKTYNEHVNTYTTALKQFPGTIFAALWGFEMYDFYKPEPRELEYHPLDYESRLNGQSHESTDLARARHSRRR